MVRIPPAAVRDPRCRAGRPAVPPRDDRGSRSRRQYAAGFEAVSKRRSALRAEESLSVVGTLKHGQLSARYLEVLLINAGKGTKVIAELLFAHAAAADRRIRWRGMERVTHRTTLAAAGDSLLVQDSFPHSSVRPVAMVRLGCLATALEYNDVTVSILLYY